MSPSIVLSLINQPSIMGRILWTKTIFTFWIVDESPLFNNILFRRQLKSNNIQSIKSNYLLLVFPISPDSAHSICVSDALVVFLLIWKLTACPSQASKYASRVIMHRRVEDRIQQAKAAQGAGALFRKNVFHCKPISLVYSLNASATSKSPPY